MIFLFFSFNAEKSHKKKRHLLPLLYSDFSFLAVYFFSNTRNASVTFATSTNWISW